MERGEKPFKEFLISTGMAGDNGLNEPTDTCLPTVRVIVAGSCKPALFSEAAPLRSTRFPPPLRLLPAMAEEVVGGRHSRASKGPSNLNCSVRALAP
ncbi:hypothetical protein P7K49_031859 [Saguinus oedipus]|uniref:Uncharacterized protein n=1 Tax=Saguinus oedipus TaxID=9490 RepID=A0ABQ9U0L1_SAGOE|nr:hypothetical protein P7K49_031859 [Saguinus oedipus]